MQPEANHRPRVGVPWRAVAEEREHRRAALDPYLNAIRDAGGEPVEISLLLEDQELAHLADSLDGVVLSGSAADVDPRRYHAVPHEKTAAADKAREHADDFLLQRAFAAGKPVLAICYGVQLLNVHLGGSLLQDIRSEWKAAPRVNHNPRFHGLHAVQIKGGRLADLAREVNGSCTVRVNSTHHQAVLQPGRGLRVTALAPDGVVEAVEWAGDDRWVVGVQWHPERMRGDALARALFSSLVAQASRRPELAR